MRRALLAITSFASATVVLYWLLSEAAVRYELWSTGALSRSELADDFGLGILGIGFVVPASVIGGLLVALGVWRWKARGNGGR
jgi:hypothetical protein